MRIIRSGLVCVVLAVASEAIAGQARLVAELPFEFVRNEPVVKVTVNGHGPLNMMLDTGTDPSAIDLATAASIGLNRSSKGQAASGGGTEKNLAYETKFETLEIGGLSAHKVAAAAIDLSKISERMQYHIDGVLGYSLFRDRIVQFDYPARMARFYDTMPASEDPTAVSMKFRYADNVLIEGVKVDGVAVVANLDTGSSGSFSIVPKAIEKLGLTAAAATGVVRSSVGYNGRSENREGTVKNIQIGAIYVDSPTVIFMSKGTGYDKRAWDVNIGNVFFKDYVVTFDFKTKTVRFEKPL